MLRSLGKFRLNFVNDVRKLYNIVQQQNYETQARDSLSHTKKKYHKTIDEQLHLALRWSIGDTIEHQSATTTKIWNDTNKIKQNRLLLIDALSKNMLMFVMNFMKLDIDFTVLFRPPDTPSTKVGPHWSHKYHYLQELYSDTKRDFMLPLYETQLDIKLLLLGTEGNAEHMYRDLFLWCILTYRPDMAKIFLSQLKTRICSALIASKILKSLAAYAPDQVAKDTLFAKANDFETHAIEFVRCAYFNDKHKACELIMRCTNHYGGVTCLQMAIVADNKRFLHEDACQALLTNI
ncbi:unnamed protein product [Adineta steineri]|uniref:TRPM-like domain-containing protein n=1 Tax=Adineta steineri TaxID=433720 RepID=A0A819Z495_9BILA|nr:unnamed protein product [Adineta steineri]